MNTASFILLVIAIIITARVVYVRSRNKKADAKKWKKLTDLNQIAEVETLDVDTQPEVALPTKPKAKAKAKVVVKKTATKTSKKSSKKTK